MDINVNNVDPLPPVKISGKEIAPQLDYGGHDLEAPVYKFTKLTQVSGGTTQALSASTTLNTFNLPSNVVYNFNRSFIIFDLSISACTNANYNVVQTDSVPIDYIQLLTQGGDLIANIQNCQEYTKVVRPLHTPLDEYNSLGPAVPATTVAASGYATNHYLQPGTWLQGAATAALVAGTIDSRYMTDATAGTTSVSLGMVATGNAVTYAASGSDKPNAPQGLLVSAVENSDSASVLTIHCKIPLKAFAGSVLSMDKNIYFGQNMQIKINWKALSKWGFQTSSLTATNSTASALAGVSLTNYYLWACKDTNPVNINKMASQFAIEGFNLLVPYCDGSQRPSPASSTSFTYSTLITPGSGLAVKRILTTAINGNNDLSSVASANNVNQAKYSQLQSDIDAKYIQDAPLDLTQQEDYNYVFNMIRNTAAGLSARCYAIRPVWVDNFSDCDDGSKWNDNDCLYSGLDIGSSYRTYNVKYTIGSSSVPPTFYQWIVYLKRLRINPLGVKYI